MKRVVSVSLGSSVRDHRVSISFHGEEFEIERIGTDASLERALELIRSLDGRIDAFGMGGIDLYLWAGKRRYVINDAKKIKAAAVKTPMLDGSGLKNTLERSVIDYLAKNKIIDFEGKRVLITSAMDRFGMAESLAAYNSELVIGDLMFALGLNIPMYSLRTLRYVARAVAPIACRLPFTLLYPTGDKQKENNATRLIRHYQQSDIIAGDYHYIRRFMPEDMKNKTIITNTVTREDVEELRARGVALLVTTTPELEGRSFGTNVIEAMLVAILRGNKQPESEENYMRILEELNFKPRVEYLNQPIIAEGLRAID